MDLLHAAVLGIVEGLTEFVPVSSTGHLILAGAWLGLPESAGVHAFDIVIQAGAWLACVVYYAPLLRNRLAALRAADPVQRRKAWSLGLSLGIAFVPLMAVGLVFRKQIKALLFGPGPVAIALAVGGVAMILLDGRLRGRATKRTLDDVDVKTAATVGAFQCLALWPGTSRSMSSMVGGMIAGLDTRTAADFSFLLAIPVLGAATGYELLKEWKVLVSDVGVPAIALGLSAAFVTGWASIAGFLTLVGRYGLKVFGVYRIVLAAVVYWSLLRPV